MKRLLILLFLFSKSFAQQKDTISNATITVNNGNTTTVYNNVTIIIPHQSSTTGASQKYVDSAVGNKALQSYVQTSLFLKQDKLIQGANISISANNVISATGGSGGWPDTFNLGEQKQLLFVKPFNYGVIYPNGRQQGGWGIMGYATHEGVNPDGIPDQVWQDPASYNSYPNGARINPKDISTSSRTELYYYIPGIGYCLERHLFEFTDMKSGVHRALSYYGRRDDGMQGFWNMEGTLSLFMPQLPFAQPKQFISFQDANIVMTATQAGRKIGINATDIFNNSKIDFTSTGGVFNLDATSSLGNNWHKDGYGHDDDGLKVYANDAAAKADGLKFHDGYYRLVNGIEIRTRVTTQ